MNTVGIIMARLGLDTRDFKTGLAEASSVTGKFSAALLGIPNIAGVLGVGAVATEIAKITSYAEHVEHLSERFGVSTTVIQQWGRAAEENGSSMEAVASAFNKLEVARSKAMAGDEAMLTNFNKLGVSMNDVANAKPDELMKKIGQGSGDAAAGVKVLGKNWTDLRPIIDGVADGTIKFQKSIDEINVKNLAEADRLLKSIYHSGEIELADYLGGTITRLSALKEAGVGAWTAIKNAATLNFSESAKGLKQMQRAGSVLQSPESALLDLLAPGAGSFLAHKSGDAEKKPSGPTPEETKQAAELQQKIDKEKTIVAILTLQLGHQDALAASLRTQLDFEEKINAAHKAGLDDVAKELEIERNITLALQAQVIAEKNKEKLRVSLKELAAVAAPETVAGAGLTDRGEPYTYQSEGDPNRMSLGAIWNAHQARAAQDLEAQARDLVLNQADMGGAARLQSRANDIKAPIETLTNTEKDISGQFKRGLDESEVLKKIQENTAKDLVSQ